MLVFLLWWTLGSSLCYALAATIATLSFKVKSWRLIELAVVTNSILVGIVQWIVLNAYFSQAYQWGLVTTIGGIVSSCLVALGLLLFLLFQFKGASLVGFGSSSPSQESTLAAFIVLIIYLFAIGFLLGLGQNFILQTLELHGHNEISILTGLAWSLGTVFWIIYFFALAKSNSFKYIIVISLLGTIFHSIQGWLIGKLLDANGILPLDDYDSLWKALVKLGGALAIVAIIFYPFRYRILEFLGFTGALYQAVVAGKIDAEKYLAGGGNLDFNLQSSSLLHQAVAKDNESLIKFLLEQGVNINQKDRNGYVPLHGARNKKIAEYLLAHGANVNSQANLGNTPLHFLASAKEIVELLLGRGADPQIRNNQGQTPLHNINNPDSLKILIANGAEVDARDLEGLTPLYYSIKSKKRWNELPSAIQQRAKVTICFIEHGADVNIRDVSGNTLLHLTYDKQVIESLIAHGADVNARDLQGNTPLHYKCLNLKNKELVEVLIANGADVNARNNNGRTPLYWANDREIIEIFLNHGAEINVRDNQGRTPLHSVPLNFIANRRGPGELTKVLLTHGADVMAKDNEGKTLLHYIVNAEVRTSEFSLLKEFVELLIEYGADINAVDNEGKTPLDDEILQQKELQKMSEKKEIPTKDEKLKLLQSYGGVCSKSC